MFNVIFPAAASIFSLILGIIITNFFENQRHSRRLEQENSLKRTDRLEVRALKQLDFQVETLLSAQEAIFELSRNVSQINFADTMNFRETGEWGKKPHSEKLSEEARQSAKNCALLNSRIADDQVRQALDKFRTNCTLALFAASQESANRLLNQMSEEFVQLNDMMGKKLTDLNFLSLNPSDLEAIKSKITQSP